MRLTKQSISVRKEKIIHTAYELFCKHGVDGVTLAQIAKEANVGASAIYRYFDTKTNLLGHTQKILWKEIVDEFHVIGQESISATASGFEELSILLYRFKALYEQHSSYILFATEYKMYLVKHKIKLPVEDYDQILNPVYGVFIAAFRRGQTDGTIKSEESAEDQFFAVWGIMRSYVEQITIYDNMYAGENHWKNRFEQVYRYVLNAVKNEQ